MNDTPRFQRDWSTRIGAAIQRLSEWIVLLLLLAAVCAISAPANGFPTEVFFPKGYLMTSGVQAFVLIWWCIVLLPIAWLAYRDFWAQEGVGLIQKRLERPFLAALLGLLVLVLIVVLGAFPAIYPDFFRYLVSGNQGASFSPIALIPLIVLLAASRTCRRPLPFCLASLLVIGGLLSLVYWILVRPVILEVHGSLNSLPVNRILKPGIMVSCHFMPLRTSLMVLVPFLLAVYAVRRRFAWWKAALGWLTGYLAIHAALFVSLPAPNRMLLFGVVTNFALLFFMLRLPGQRRAMQRLTGIDFACEPDEPAASGGAISSLVAHGTLIVLLLSVAAFAVIGVFEKRISVVMAEGLPAPYRSPALVNAFTQMKPYFTKGVSRDVAPKWSDEFIFMHAITDATRAKLDEIKPLVDFAAIDKEIDAMNPALAAYIAAAGADYCLVQEPGRATVPHFVNLRTVARAVTARANMNILRNRPVNALRDIEVNLRLAWLMNGDPNASLVAHMIATAIRGLAIGPMENYYYYYRNDPAALDLLRAFLERNAALAHIDFPSESIARMEPGFWPVNPYFEIMVPGLIQANTVFYGRWANYDLLLLATALEAYRRDTGRYPDDLAQLAPKYLPTLPHEPVWGKPYRYLNFGPEFLLSFPMAGDDKKQGEFVSNPKGDNKYMQGCLEKLKNKHRSGA